MPDVVVLEAGDRLGGKVRSEPFAGRRVDVAADAFLARRPEATDLCRELGLAEELVPVGASGAAVWARGRLRPMPDGLNLGVPTRWWPLLRSGILSPGECLRLSHDLVLPRLGRGGVPVGDRSVGEIVGGRLGRPVVDRLVDPLIGGIHAGDADQLSAAATFPVLIAASHQSGSLMRRLGAARVRAAPSPVDGRPPPVFWSLAGTTASLVDELAAGPGGPRRLPPHGHGVPGPGPARRAAYRTRCRTGPVGTDPGVGGVGTRCPGLASRSTASSWPHRPRRLRCCSPPTPRCRPGC